MDGRGADVHLPGSTALQPAPIHTVAIPRVIFIATGNIDTDANIVIHNRGSKTRSQPQVKIQPARFFFSNHRR